MITPRVEIELDEEKIIAAGYDVARVREVIVSEYLSSNLKNLSTDNKICFETNGGKGDWGMLLGITVMLFKDEGLHWCTKQIMFYDSDGYEDILIGIRQDLEGCA